jgi:hypothetical protein
VIAQTAWKLSVESKADRLDLSEPIKAIGFGDLFADARSRLRAGSHLGTEHAQRQAQRGRWTG